MNRESTLTFPNTKYRMYMYTNVPCVKSNSESRFGKNFTLSKVFKKSTAKLAAQNYYFFIQVLQQDKQCSWHYEAICCCFLCIC